jgi:dTDP-4-dehydrorhamnose 3,5-epimerase
VDKPSIEGVTVTFCPRRSDDRGWLVELAKRGEMKPECFGQNVLTLAYPGVIKAFHWHEHQEDYWTFIKGNAQVVLYDRRPGSKTFDQTEVFYMGEDTFRILKIPRGVAHGYRVLGNEPALLLYTVTQEYNSEAPDEHRIPYDDPEIAFDWTTQMR